MSLDDIVPVNVKLDGAQPFERAIALAINDALPLLERKLPMSPDGVAILRGRVAGGIDLFLAAMVRHADAPDKPLNRRGRR